MVVDNSVSSKMEHTTLGTTSSDYHTPSEGGLGVGGGGRKCHPDGNSF